MEDIVQSLKIECVKAGTNLTEVCRRAGVHRTTVERWEKKLPKSFTALQALQNAIAEIKREKEQPASQAV